MHPHAHTKPPTETQAPHYCTFCSHSLAILCTSRISLLTGTPFAGGGSSLSMYLRSASASRYRSACTHPHESTKHKTQKHETNTQAKITRATLGRTARQQQQGREGVPCLQREKDGDGLAKHIRSTYVLFTYIIAQQDSWQNTYTSPIIAHQDRLGAK